MRILLLEETKGDLLAAHAFYETQQAGVGDYFLDTVSSEIDSLVLHAGAPQVARSPSFVGAAVSLLGVLRQGRRRSSHLRGAGLPTSTIVASCGGEET
jgi:hypothetical protein